MPLVTAINSSTGARVAADEVAFNSAAQITVKFTLPIDGTYLLYIENPDGNAVQTSAVLTVSDAPAWQTAAGSLGSFPAGSSFGTITLTATDSVSMAKVSGTFPGGMTLNSGSGSSTLTGTESGATAETQYSFTIRATDAQGQTADRAFTIITVGINESEGIPLMANINKAQVNGTNRTKSTISFWVNKRVTADQKSISI